ncbi:MAG: TetR/AcrR family transcriptional regulator [Coriobacteriales bacterium]
MNHHVEESKRARTAVQRALFALMDEKAFSDITVSDVVRASGVARSTYYRNFASKEQVLESFVEDMHDELADRRARFGRGDYDYFGEDELAAALTYYEERRDFILKLYGNGFGSMVQGLFNLHAIDELGDMPAGSVERYRIYAFAGAMANVLVEWLREGAKETPGEMARLLIRVGRDIVGLDG